MVPLPHRRFLTVRQLHRLHPHGQPQRYGIHGPWHPPRRFVGQPRRVAHITGIRPRHQPRVLQLHRPHGARIRHLRGLRRPLLCQGEPRWRQHLASDMGCPHPVLARRRLAVGFTALGTCHPRHPHRLPRRERPYVSHRPSLFPVGHRRCAHQRPSTRRPHQQGSIHHLIRRLQHLS